MLATKKHSFRTNLKQLKRTGRCEVFLVFDRRAPVIFGSPTQTVGESAVQFDEESVEGCHQRNSNESTTKYQ